MGFDSKHEFTPPTILLEKAMAPHYSTLAWKIPWMEEPGKAAVHGVTEVQT